MNISSALKVASALKGGFGQLQLTRSTAASAAAAGVVGVLGAVLIAQNVLIPFVGLPITADEVTAAMWLVHTGVNLFTSDSTKEQIVGLAMKAQDVVKMLPGLTADYAITKDDPFATHPVAAAAVAVIQAHVEAQPSGYPAGKNGA